jgi:putative acetyltransferase
VSRGAGAVVLRREQSGDERAIHEVEAEAFEREDEAELVDRLRARGRNFLSLVATSEGAIVGHLLLTRVRIEGAREDLLLLGLAPVAVTAARQRSGIGSQLVRASLQVAREGGAAGMVVLGHPEYYPRFGFVPARDLELFCDYDPEGGAFFVQELAPGALTGLRGRVRYASEFDEGGPEPAHTDRSPAAPRRQVSRS